MNFVEYESKNYVLMSWVMANIELRGNQAQIKDISVNGLLVRGGQSLTYTDHNWVQRLFSMIQCSLSLLFPFFYSPTHGGSSTLYSSFLIIQILHLLIIWIPTWVPIPLDTPFSLLWVVTAKAALFRSPLHVNVARKVAAVHLIWWWQFFLRYFEFYSFSHVHGTHYNC